VIDKGKRPVRRCVPQRRAGLKARKTRAIQISKSGLGLKWRDHAFGKKEAKQKKRIGALSEVGVSYLTKSRRKWMDKGTQPDNKWNRQNRNWSCQREKPQEQLPGGVDRRSARTESGGGGIQ